jgi:hypothetical protein
MRGLSLASVSIVRDLVADHTNRLEGGDSDKNEDSLHGD